MRTLLVLCALAAACGGSAAPASSPSPAPSASTATAAAPDRIDGAKAHELVAAGAKLVDVRSSDEFDDKHIDGAINVPVDGIASHDFGGKDKPLVLYCHTGGRSQKAAEALRAAGYTQVYVLGPMSAW